MDGCVGRGAWQDWSYEVQLVNSRTNRTTTLGPQRGVSTTASGLLPGCVYHVRLRASSTEGVGPWSHNFTAQTLSTGLVLDVLISVHVIGVKQGYFCWLCLSVCLFVSFQAITQKRTEAVVMKLGTHPAPGEALTFK